MSDYNAMGQFLALLIVFHFIFYTLIQDFNIDLLHKCLIFNLNA